VTSARHALRIKAARTGFSAADCLVYLAIVAFGPYEGALLAAVDALVGSRRIEARPALYAFNASNNALAALLAGTVYGSMTRYLAYGTVVGGPGRSVLVFALPLAGMAAAYYLVSVGLAGLMLHLVIGSRIDDVFSKRFPWEPAGHLACATT